METKLPEWLNWDNKKRELTVKGTFSGDGTELLFDPGQIIEYYQR
jgi:hypothetical protein